MTTEQVMNPWHGTTDQSLLRRLGKLSEELGELQAVIGRIIIQGIDEVDPSSGQVNRQRFYEEIADVAAQLAVTVTALQMPEEELEARAERKIAQMRQWEELLVAENADPTPILHHPV